MSETKRLNELLKNEAIQLKEEIKQLDEKLEKAKERACEDISYETYVTYHSTWNTKTVKIPTCLLRGRVRELEEENIRLRRSKPDVLKTKKRVLEPSWLTRIFSA